MTAGQVINPEQLAPVRQACQVLVHRALPDLAHQVQVRPALLVPERQAHPARARLNNQLFLGKINLGKVDFPSNRQPGFKCPAFATDHLTG